MRKKDMAMMNAHGGRLVEIAQAEPSRENTKEALENKTVKVSSETQVTLSNISNGVLSPLEGFMGQEDYQSVLDSMRLSNDTPWTLPVLLHVPSDFGGIGNGDEITLVSEENGAPVARLAYEESYTISKKEYAQKVFGTEDEAHPGVAKVYGASDKVVAGKLKSVRKYSDRFDNYCLQPKDTRILFQEKGWKSTVAFQTRNAPHIGHEYVQKTALAFADGIFINPVLGKKKSGDFTDDAIFAAYQALVKNYYPKNSVVLSVLHYEMQYAGPREAIIHAIMRKNFGCTNIAIGRDHAGVGNYYGPYAAQEIFKEFPDLGIAPIFLREFYYCTKCYGIANEKICPHPETDRLTFSGTKLRKMFQAGEKPPKEFMRPEVAETILQIKEPFVA